MNKALSRLQLSLNAAASEPNSPSKASFLSVSLTCVCVCVKSAKVRLDDGTSACQRGGAGRAAHPCFESALNVSDAPLSVTLSLGDTQPHTQGHTDY